MPNWGRTFVFSFFIVSLVGLTVSPLCQLQVPLEMLFTCGKQAFKGLDKNIYNLRLHICKCEYNNISHYLFAVPKEKTQDNKNMNFYILWSSLFAFLMVLPVVSFFSYRRLKRVHFNEIPKVSCSCFRFNVYLYIIFLVARGGNHKLVAVAEQPSHTIAGAEGQRSVWRCVAGKAARPGCGR